MSVPIVRKIYRLSQRLPCGMIVGTLLDDRDYRGVVRWKITTWEEYGVNLNHNKDCCVPLLCIEDTGYSWCKIEDIGPGQFHEIMKDEQSNS